MKEQSRKRKKKKKGGFQVGNELYASSSAVRVVCFLYKQL